MTYPLTDETATALVTGLVFCVRKTRSDIQEAFGDIRDLLADLMPAIFDEETAGVKNLLAWEQRCRESGVIKGMDLFNIYKWLDMGEARFALALLHMYGYPDPQEADILWFAQTWKWTPRQMPGEGSV